MRIEFLSRGEKKTVERELKEIFGIPKLNFLLIRSGKEKIRAYSGVLSKEEIKKLSQVVNIEGIGLYAAKQENNETRLTLDALHLLKNEIRTSIIELDDEQIARWMKGENIEIASDKKGVFILKNKGDFIGSGKASQGKLYNFIPKERRMR